MARSQAVGRRNIRAGGEIVARPSKQTVEYFPHFVRPGKTLFILESKWGNTGYSFWFKMLEVLGESDGHVLRYNEPDTRDYFLARCGIQHGEAVQIFSKLVELKKIDRELWENREWVWCHAFVENLKVVYAKRTTSIPVRPALSFKEESRAGVFGEKTRVSGEKTQFPGRKQNRSPMSEIVFGEKTPQSKVKERKGEGSVLYNDNDIDNNIVMDKVSNDNVSSAPPPAEHRPAPLLAPPALGQQQYPETDILTVADAYCTAKGVRFHTESAKNTYLRSRAVFYDAKDFLALNGGNVERACLAIQDFAREYVADGKTDWNWRYIMQDWVKPEWGKGVTWDELRRNYELEQQQEKAGK